MNELKIGFLRVFVGKIILPDFNAQKTDFDKKKSLKCEFLKTGTDKRIFNWPNPIRFMFFFLFIKFIH